MANKTTMYSRIMSAKPLPTADSFCNPPHLRRTTSSNGVRQEHDRFQKVDVQTPADAISAVVRQ